ncbi:hypothetical protein CR513_39957, partial [Mucuna pruriens]
MEWCKMQTKGLVLPLTKETYLNLEVFLQIPIFLHILLFVMNNTIASTLQLRLQSPFFRFRR